MSTPVQLTLKDKNSGKALAKVKEPTTLKVVVLDLIEDLLAKVYVEKNDKQSYTGYITKAEYDELNVSSVTIPESFAGLEAVAVPTRLKEQLFRIYEVEENENYVTVKARHVWYDNLQNYTLWKPTEDTQYTGAAVCRNILTNAISPVDSNVASDCTDEKPGSEFDYERKNLVECFLDPENGVCAKYGLSLIRDNWDFYCLKEVGYDRGFVIENGKNLLGVVRNESIENVATRIVPYGLDANGDIVWLDNEGVKYVDSPYINDYSFPRVYVFDTGLQVGQDDVTDANINDKLKAAAEALLTDDKVDLPEVTMTIDFLSIGDTEEYQQYKDLDKVYLYDIVTIKDTVRGYEYTAQVVGVEHDILTGMLNSITLGKIQNSDGIRKIAIWQVPEISGENIRLKSIMSGSFAAGAILASDIAAGAIETVHLKSATIDDLTATNITAVTARIHEIIAGSITADDIQTGSLTADVIAAGAITAAKIAAEAITSEKIYAGAVTATKIAASAITTDKLDAYAVTSQKIAAEAITTEKLAANAVTADKISATDLVAINAKLGTAQIAIAEIGNADISYAKIKDLTAGTAIFDTSITQQGIADRLYINRLLITYGQMVEATIGDLVIGASDGNYYHVDVSWSASGVPTLVPTQVTTPSAAEIAAGHTSSGKTIIGDVGTYAELCSSDFYAINSIIDVITAKRINVDELWARQAFINKLMVTDISSNTYIQSTIGNWTSGSTITQTIDGLNSRISSLGYGTVYMQPDEPDHSNLSSGDVWIQTLADTSWQDIYNNTTDFPTWQDIYDDVSTWQTVGAIPIMWVWDGRNFQLMYDALLPTTMETEIEQLASAITLRATKTEVNALSDEVTEFRAELIIQADEIESAVSTVNAKAASFVMWDDPRTVYTVSIGDIWVKRDPEFCDNSTWQSVYNDISSWNELYAVHDTWADMLGDKTYVWNGFEWVETSDRATDIYHRTLIDQTSEQVMILAEASAQISGELYQTRAELTVTNNSILQEVQRATSAEGGKLDKTTRYQTADAIVSEAVSQAATNASGSYIAKTSILQTADAIVQEATRESASSAAGLYLQKTSQYQTADAIVTEAVSQASTNASTYYLRKTTTYQSAEQIYSEAVRQAGANAATQYIQKTGIYQTAESIKLAAVEESETYADENCYAIQSGIAILAAGIEISGGKYIKIKSGGYFSVDSGNFSVDASGNVIVQGTVRATAGYLNSWKIEGDYLWSGTGAAAVVLDSNASRNYAIYAGTDYADLAAYQAAGSPAGKTYNAPFRVKRDGTLTITKLMALNQNGTETEVNLRTIGLWKLGYETVKPLTIQTDSGGYCTSFQLSNGTTVNFRTAAAFVMTGAWSGRTFTVSNNQNSQTVPTTLTTQGSTGGVSSPDLTLSDFYQHKAHVLINGSQSSGTHTALKILVDATSEYESVEVSGIERQSGSTFSTNKKTVYFNVRGVAENGNVGNWTEVSADVTEAYEAGEDSVYVSGAERQSGNTFSDNKKTVYFNVRGIASNGDTGDWTQVSADVSTSYTAGENSVTATPGEWSSGVNTVTLTNGSTCNVSMPEVAYWSEAWAGGTVTVYCTVGGKTYSHTVDT